MLITLIVTSTPVFCIMLGFMLRSATVTVWHLLCAALGIGEAMMLLLPSAALTEGSSRFWLGAAIGVPVSYALYNLYVAWSVLLLDEQITPWMNVSISAIVLSLFLCLVGDRSQARRASLSEA
ncbi:hypothetical protein [Pseudomonas sp. MWU12-2345]|uniref:hypothetical protein n=1 Tax=Pseudomonas sp. MWU12-2345 TaxID=2928689 RepID=UPI00200DD21C|nr:hypothetical protein [Pseudomonas sp. MWU12-2345]